jgi:hypothetical protein
MIPSEEFWRRAAECDLMAKNTRDPQSRDTWNRMAQRWTRCAETASNQSLTARLNAPAKRHRRPAPAWAAHQ